MFQKLSQPYEKQPNRGVLTTLIAVKDEHIRLVRKVNVKNGWGGEVLATIEPNEHRVLCECVSLRLITINEDGLFNLGPLGASFLEEHGSKSVYHFMNSETGEFKEVTDLEMLLLQTAAYTEDGVSGIGNTEEIDIIKGLEEIGLVHTREQDDKIDFYLTKKGVDFLIDEGYLLG